MTENTENWQAIAHTLIAELDADIGKALTVRYGLHWALSLNDRDFFKRILDRLGELGHARPKHKSD